MEGVKNTWFDIEPKGREESCDVVANCCFVSFSYDLWKWNAVWIKTWKEAIQYSCKIPNSLEFENYQFFLFARLISYTYSSACYCDSSDTSIDSVMELRWAGTNGNRRKRRIHVTSGGYSRPHAAGREHPRIHPHPLMNGRNKQNCLRLRECP